MEPDATPESKPFVPRGAISFFMALIGIYTLIFPFFLLILVERR